MASSVTIKLYVLVAAVFCTLLFAYIVGMLTENLNRCRVFLFFFFFFFGIGFDIFFPIVICICQHKGMTMSPRLDL